MLMIFCLLVAPRMMRTSFFSRRVKNLMSSIFALLSSGGAATSTRNAVLSASQQMIFVSGALVLAIMEKELVSERCEKMSIRHHHTHHKLPITDYPRLMNSPARHACRICSGGILFPAHLTRGFAPSSNGLFHSRTAGIWRPSGVMTGFRTGRCQRFRHASCRA